MKRLFLLPLMSILLVSGAAFGETEAEWSGMVYIRGFLDCYGKMSLLCGGFDDMDLLSDRFRRGQPGSGI